MTAQKLVLILAANLGCLGVILGAFGGHVVKDKFCPEMTAVYEVGVRYQMYHAIALLCIGLTIGQFGSSSLLSASAGLIFGGTLLFSVSLYALALSGIKILGIITPIGGVLMIMGWLAFGLGVYRIDA
ncbi:MAG: uncharacterized membrane protein YgdD (TMEM256/DUF423 family) [Chlamydiales bacterium]|jgi:uncharacterized membrane protein YgdD (TMEM256/DUF423 family)